LIRFSINTFLGKVQGINPIGLEQRKWAGLSHLSRARTDCEYLNRVEKMIRMGGGEKENS
jgi:hypothetical protein